MKFAVFLWFIENIVYGTNPKTENKIFNLRLKFDQNIIFCLEFDLALKGQLHEIIDPRFSHKSTRGNRILSIFSANTMLYAKRL
jgi:hypothetical protein